ncbi:MAG: 50S ribosomal protein L11 methyltransferase [Salibacter sp.]|uniref:50S ribosomal protein L11 methyltransferase n=1 Tax=Salibacter sp. TaxID=2010995 RepID=UPI00286FE52C|nr:50S ribosomal protein L11 methyltransferase [Salibacter sp.]MDR9397918.1 50S ribosomal protein L11 methyltransferase [Salibacter sp.]
MNWIEVAFTIQPSEPWADLLPQDLADLGYESFSEENDKLLAYVSEDKYSETDLDALINQLPNHVQVNYTTKTIADQNWNAEWERNFEPIRIGKKLLVRAPFHEADDSVEMELVIEPKMAFGTGHHATTALIAERLLDMDLTDKRILDMGCGTSILAIIAKKRGAGDILAVDIDEWSVRSSEENIVINNTPGIDVRLGDIDVVPADDKFDMIIANINRNIILRHLEHYAALLKEGGVLLTSGFYQSDVPVVDETAQKLGLIHVDMTTKDKWANVLYKKE